MKIWKNTATINGYDEGLTFTNYKIEADIALIGSKPINLDEFPRLKGIFRAGVGKDNIPIEEAGQRGISVKFPSDQTIEIIFEETANFTCSLIMRMMYQNVGSVDQWVKNDRDHLSAKSLLVIGTGNIGMRVAEKMNSFMRVLTFDILINSADELKNMISEADCVTLHIPKNAENISFLDAKKLGWMKEKAVLVNTARGALVDENALYSELKNKRLFAAFDVFWQEPYTGTLKEFFPYRFFMTPHVASTCKGFVEGCRRNLDDLIIELQKK